MISIRPLLASAVCLCLVSTTLLGGENWPQYRGPEGDGHSDSTGLPTTLSETENVKWKTDIHGKGWSSPVIWGEQIWLTTANPEGTELSVLCLDKATGKVQRDEVLFHVSTPQEAHRFNSYASPTPVIEEGRVYVTFGSPGTACLDTKTGKVLWQRTDLECNHFRGAGSSPILWKNLLIMNFDGSDFEYVIALDKETGKTVWKTDRSVDYGDTEPNGKRQADGDFRKAFATPHVAEIEGRPVLFSSGAKAHYAYDPATGKEFWRIEEKSSHSASARPVLGHGMVYLQTGYSKGCILALKLPSLANWNGEPKVLTEADLAWKGKTAVPKKPSMLLDGELAYTIDDSGIAIGYDALTGAELWRQRVQGNYSSSPILVEGHIYTCSEEGKVAVLQAGREFKQLAENKLPDGIMASPAVSGKALYLRTKSALYRFEQ